MSGFPVPSSPSGAAGGVLSGTYPSPGLAAAATAGDTFYATAAGTITNLPIGGVRQFIKTSSGLPSWGELYVSRPTAVLVTANPYDCVIATSGSFVVTSPAARAGMSFEVVNQGPGVTTVTVASGTISGPGVSGATSILLTTGGYLQLTSDGTNWVITAGGNPPGYEIGYAQVTAPVAITDTSEATATSLISSGALNFDGGPVMVEFFSPDVTLGAGINTQLTFCLFEASTEIARLATILNEVAGVTGQSAMSGRLRFTPSVGSHTYKLTAFSAVAGTLGAGNGGTNGYPPAFLRFAKV